MRPEDWVKKATEVFAKGDMRFDAAQSMMLERQLEHMVTELYDIEYPTLKAKTLFPVDHSVPTGAETYVYRSFDKVGQAKIGGNYSDDSPLVNGSVTETPGKIVPLRDAYAISIQDIRAAAMAGVPISSRLAETARYVIEQGIDDLVANGNADVGISGVLDHPDVPAAITPDTGTWSTASPDEIIVDVQKLWHSISTATNMIHRPNTLVVDTTSWQRLQVRLTDNDITVARWLLQNLDNCQAIEQWHYLDTAGSGGVPRLMAYDRTPRVVSIIIPQEFEQFEPERNGLVWKTECHARCGGIDLFYPHAFAYMDGIGG
jgi:hypothetical protein